MNGSLSLANQQISLDVTTENAAIARRMYTLIKRLYPHIHIELLVRKKMRLKKNNVYLVRITKEARELLGDLHILKEPFEFIRTISPSIVQNACCKRAYLRGVFGRGVH